VSPDPDSDITTDLSARTVTAKVQLHHGMEVTCSDELLESCSALPDELTGNVGTDCSFSSPRKNDASDDVFAFGCMLQDTLQLHPASVSLGGTPRHGNDLPCAKDALVRLGSAGGVMSSLCNVDPPYEDPFSALLTSSHRTGNNLGAHRMHRDAAESPREARCWGSQPQPFEVDEHAENEVQASVVMPMTVATLVHACQGQDAKDMNAVRPSFQQIALVLVDLEEELSGGWFLDMHGRIQVRCTAPVR
jgi:hypothetical protein